MQGPPSTPFAAELGYRRDIDGMRGIAVLAVLGFHAFPQLIPGGFIGVDIFFVISGYLITGIVAADIRHTSFSLATFYARRIRRIFPALAIVLAASLFIGWRILLDVEFQRLGKQVIAGAGFSANFLLWHESGYFDTDARLKPLLHLWSLGIEEQFYIVWPIALMLFGMKNPKRSAFPLAALITAASFLLTLYTVGTSAPTDAFYSPLCRAWELGLGAMLALSPRRKSGPPRPHIASLGAGMIILGLFLLDRYVTYPGTTTLLPTLGAAALIWTGPDSVLNSRILGNRILVGVGLISYPLYLWHWPLLSFAHIAQPQGLNPVDTVGIVAASFALAWITYRLVEVPIRRNLWRPLPLTMAMVVLGFAGCLCVLGALRPWSFGMGLEKIMSAESGEKFPGKALQPFGYAGRMFYQEGSGSRTTAYIGDSTIQSYFMRVDAVLRAQHPQERKVVFATLPGCIPIPGVEAEKSRKYCGAFARAAAHFALEPNVDVVVVGAHWSYYFQNDDGFANYVFNDGASKYPLGPGSEGWRMATGALGRWITDLRKSGKRVYLILEAPFGNQLAPWNLVRRTLWRGFKINAGFVDREVLLRLTSQATLAVREAGAANGAYIIDPLETLCDDQQCAALSADGEPIYADPVHLRPEYIRDRVSYLDATLIPEAIPRLRQPPWGTSE